MSDETEVVVPPKRKAGRPPKKRHDPEPAPIDGDYQNDHITGKQAGWDYGLVSDRLRGKYLAYGWQVERWGAGCARPLWDYGEHKDGEEVRINNQLTLMKIPTDRRNKINQRERQWHTDAKAALKRTAENTGGKFNVFKGVNF